MNSEEILDALIKSGKITEDDLLKVDTSFYVCVNTIHSLLCFENHDEEEGPITCKFREEEEHESTWNLPTHVEWRDAVKNFMDEFEVTDREALEKVIREGIKIMDCSRASYFLSVCYRRLTNKPFLQIFKTKALCEGSLDLPTEEFDLPSSFALSPDNAQESCEEL